ncbi:hypothetical protein [Streptomyces lunaelactis]|uniref:hypothetical protein n=1 Tax=Streptomyces lunaelactis TaxID=1535768 RepID=UPI0015854D1F|nr:hypothetical protein [Streptomyces lunaelactis]NUK03989.1 hypothetical protein [Streptomyces lunaelactis]NUK17006.1 hypothetical protein [Streptomyces lunaelactis]
MTDDTKHAKPDLTPQEESQQKTRDNIEGTYAGTDMLERLPEIFAPFGPLPPGRSVFGSTIFEERELNDMLDILESTNPSDLENAGEALEKATTALNKAAKELADFISKTDWKSDAATEFERYGTGVVKYTWELGAYANAAGAQMKVASTGLTSVRNAMPSRDDRDVPKRPDKFPPEKQTQDNPEYQKAVQKEKDRQEAINQMNRLASFYVVSKSALASQNEPTLPTALKAAVPPPATKHFEVETGDTSSRGGISDSSRQQSNVRQAEFTGTDGSPRTDTTGLVPPSPSQDPSMEIDSVATPPATTTSPSPGATQIPSTTGPSSTGSGPVPPMVGKVGNPARATPPRAAGTSGRVPKAVGGPGASSVGRPGTTGGGGSRAVGRPTATGTGAGAAGRGGGPAARGQSPVVGRPGAAGQPMPGRPGASAQPRSGRANGIVGGTPQRAASGSAGSRIPKGTVIGGEGTATGRSSTARPGQSGAIGANPAKNAARPAGRGTPSVNGVVGTPRGGAPGRPAAGGTATGGLGSRSNQRQPGDEEERTSSRPDYLTEDEETWAARRRGAVPPVID